MGGIKYVEMTTNATNGEGGGGIPDYVPETIDCGRQIVTTAGVPAQLGSGVIGGVIIVGEFDNTGVICVGDSTVIADLATRQGVPLNPGDAVILTINNLNKIWIDSTVDGDGVTFTQVQ